MLVFLDHGWCFGYTCNKRISTFFAGVAPEKNYDIYLTSTPPYELRFRILNADENFKIRLSMFYCTSQRIDLYLNGVYVPSTNSYLQNRQTLFRNVSNIVMISFKHLLTIIRKSADLPEGFLSNLE